MIWHNCTLEVSETQKHDPFCYLYYGYSAVSSRGGQTAVESRRVHPKQIKIRISTEHLLVPRGTHVIVPCRPHCPYFHCAVKQYEWNETVLGAKTNCQNVPLALGLNILSLLQKIYINQVITNDSSIAEISASKS